MNKKVIGAASLLATGLVAGSFFAVSGANAANTTPTYPITTPATGTTTPAPTFGNANRTPETPVTGTLADELKATALTAYPGATVDRIENDSDGATYEAHLTLADGSHLTVLFGADKAISGTETAPAFGGPNGQHTPETAVTGDLATELSNLALAANAGATVDRVENDSDGATYEVHLTLADGSHVTVKFDADKNITATETGPQGGPRGPRGPHGEHGEHGQGGDDGSAWTPGTVTP